MKRYFFVIFLLSQINLEAQVYPKHQAGLGFSMLSGAGINYLHEVNPENVLKISGFMYYEGENILVRDIYANLGAEYQRNIYKSKSKRFYTLIGISLWNLHEKTYESYMENDIKYEIKTSDFNRIFNYGAGIGYEYRWRKLSISADAGIMFQNALNNKFEGIIKLTDKKNAFYPFAGISMRYIIK